ncbi:MAG: ATP-binding protein [candidate division KSB1 bacterium]|nr:ATP-binding protein [candidate division KSB1 bacterium]MDZ7295184.1 ATP-binding protein [candidate division KSB1 bacterium]MDZ7338562.1 ATP-binding protein [candidate division KSB1 bacterium]MDZ7385024.1 ATP-binding protein [candidate division KSB1 bacterium]MDZ7393369.1 ATP-binding protein [candidate division KSB1 bacterium]
MHEDIFTARLKEQDIIDKLNDICEENTATTRCSTAVWDSDANQITERHFCHRICKYYLFNNVKIRRRFCDVDDLKYARMVIQTSRPQRYVCWSGFTCFMVPIVVYDRVVGLISIGEFLTVERPHLSERFFAVVDDFGLPRAEIEEEIRNNVPVFTEENIRGLIASTEFLAQVIADILMGEISLSFNFDLLVRRYTRLAEQDWRRFSAEELSSFLILKNIIKLQNLFLRYALRKIAEEKKIALHKTLMPYQIVLTAAENLRANRDREKSYRQIVSAIRQVEEYTLQSMRGLALGDSQWLAVTEKKQVDLRKLLRQVVQGKKPLLEHKKVAVDVRVRTGGAALWGRPDDLEFLFSTLLENAIFAVEEHTGRIRLTAARENGGVVVTCADNGCGIAPEELPKIFDQGYRGRRFARLHPSGAGLGLSLARHIVHAHGGHINVESAPGRGTTFTVVFPSYALGGASSND